MQSWGSQREVERVKRQQVSVVSLPEEQQDAVMAATDLASAQYPSVLVKGHLLHVCENAGEWEVWINCEDRDFTGVCVGAAWTRQAAVQQAVTVLEAVLVELQKPEPVHAFHQIEKGSKKR